MAATVLAFGFCVPTRPYMQILRASTDDAAVEKLRQVQVQGSAHVRR